MFLQNPLECSPWTQFEELRTRASD